MYQYDVQYISNYDGDTIKFMADLGFGVYKKITVRVADIDTPELRASDPETKAKAYEAKEFVKKALSSADTIKVATYKDKTGKYGRYIADIIYDGKNLAQELVTCELARSYQ